MAGNLDPAILPMGDGAQVIVRIGTFADEAGEQALPLVADAVLHPTTEQSADSFIKDTVSTIHGADFNPWAHDFQIRSFYAGASSESWGLVVNVAPLLREALTDEGLRLVAGSFLGALFGHLIGIPSWFRRSPKEITLAAASERVREYVVWRDGIAPGQVEELEATQLQDGSYEILVRRAADGHRLLFRIDQFGSVVARVDLDEIEAFVERTASVAQEAERP